MNDSCVVLYSGGCDSTLAAAMAAESYKKVHLITYSRAGFFKTDKNPRANLERLQKRYGIDKFDIQVIDVNKKFKFVQYHNYLYYLKKYGPICMSICGLCKLAMHWQTIEYCLDNSIKDVSDGAVREMSVFPTQNMDIALKGLIQLYADFGITFSNPVFEKGKDVEKTLYEMQLIPSLKQKMTKSDKQVVCSQQILFSQFVKYYLSEHSWEEYVSNLHAFYAEKIDDLRREIQKRVLKV